jgi:predicted acetyltransferase
VERSGREVSPARRDSVGSVTIVAAPAAQRPVFDSSIACLQLYKYDFSEFAAIGSPRGELDEEGRFAHPGLESYWRDSGRIPLLIRADDHLAGFALVNQWSALELPLDHAVAEFFVLRKYRRARVGARAALFIFRRYPGRWEVGVAWYNPPALAFWRRRPPPGRWKSSPEMGCAGPAQCCASRPGPRSAGKADCFVARCGGRNRNLYWEVSIKTPIRALRGVRRH